MRLKLLSPGEMTPEQKQTYDEAIAGKRGSAPAPMMAWLNSPAMARHAGRSRCPLPARRRTRRPGTFAARPRSADGCGETQVHRAARRVRADAHPCQIRAYSSPSTAPLGRAHRPLHRTLTSFERADKPDCQKMAFVLLTLYIP